VRKLLMRVDRRGESSSSAEAGPALELFIAKIDAALTEAGRLDGVVRAVDYLDVLLDLRLAAEEIATLTTLDGDSTTESRHGWRSTHRVPLRV
jgi:hypothetical protein